MTEMTTLADLDQKFDWQTYVTRENTMLWRYIEAMGYRSENVESEVGYGTPIQCKLTKHHLKCQEESIQEMMGLIAERVENDIEYFIDVAEDCYDSCERFLDICRDIAAENVTELSDDELASRFETYVDRNSDVVAYREVVFFLDILLDDELSAELDSVNDEVDLHLDMIAPTRDLPFMEERKALLKLGKELEEDDTALTAFETHEDPGEILSELPSNFRSAIEEHAEEYGWVTTARYTGEPLSEIEIVQNLDDIIGRASESLESLQQDRAEKSAELDTIKAHGDRLETLIEIAQEYAYLRTYRMDAIFEGDYLLRDFFEEIARRGEIDYADLIQLTVPEILNILRGDSADDDLAQLAETRRSGPFVVYLIDDEITVGQGEAIADFVEDETVEENTVGIDARTEKHIQGRVAQRGEITAPAKIVQSEDQVDKVTEGDILVSPMTTPDMTVGIAKAEGIITDEGGVASHAAIISREFGIPCLIGTDIATTVLQDGDLVELEATGEEGTARLIQESA